MLNSNLSPDVLSVSSWSGDGETMLSSGLYPGDEFDIVSFTVLSAAEFNSSSLSLSVFAAHEINESILSALRSTYG